MPQKNVLAKNDIFLRLFLYSKIMAYRKYTSKLLDEVLGLKVQKIKFW